MAFEVKTLYFGLAFAMESASETACSVHSVHEVRIAIATVLQDSDAKPPSPPLMQEKYGLLQRRQRPYP